MKHIRFAIVPTNTPFKSGIKEKYSQVRKLITLTIVQITKARVDIVTLNKPAIKGTRIIGDQNPAEKITRSTT